MSDDWTTAVHPHSDLQPIAPGLWWVKGSQKGMPLPRNMVVARLPDGRLWLHSVVCLDEARMAALDALGPVGFIVVPNGGHRLDAPRFHARYPDAKVLAPAVLRAKVEEVVPVNATCEEALPSVGVSLHLPEGTRGGELVYELPLEDEARALVFNDALGNGPKLTGFAGALISLLGSGGVLGTPRIVKLRYMADKALFRTFLKQLAEAGPWQALTVSHGDPVTANVADALRAAATRL